jgi:hypothetical protein
MIRSSSLRQRISLNAFRMPRFSDTPPLKDDGFFYVSTAAQDAYEVSGKCKTQACHDLRDLHADLLEVDHVAFGEHRASPRQTWHTFSHQRQPAKIRNVDSKPKRLLIEKGTGPCRANRIHRKIFYVEDVIAFALPETDELCILSPNLDDRSCERVQVSDCSGVGNDLVDKSGIQKVCNKLAC